LGEGYLPSFMYVLFIISPFMFVFGDDHVTCYMGAYDVAGDNVDA